jgi:hypothetical protein
MNRKILCLTLGCVALAACAPKNEYDEQLTAIQCTSENTQYRVQYLACQIALAELEPTGSTQDSGSSGGPEAPILRAAGPGGMVTDPGPGGMVTDPGRGGAVSVPGIGLFYESSNSAIQACRATTLKLRELLQECFDDLALRTPYNDSDDQ